MFKKRISYKLTPELKVLRTLVDLCQHHDALDYSEELLSKYSDNPVIYYYRGLALEKEGNAAQALEQYDKALSIDGEFFPVLLKLGQIYLQRTDYVNADKYLCKALKIEKNADVYHQLGLSALMAGNEKKAVKFWKKCLKLDKNHNAAMQNLELCNVYVKKNVTLQESLEESRALEERRKIEQKIKYLEVLDTFKNGPHEIFLGRKGFAYLNEEDVKNYFWIDEPVNFQKLTKPSVKKLLKVLLSLITYLENEETDEIFLKADYGRGQYFLYMNNQKQDYIWNRYTEGRYQSKKTPEFLQFTVNSSLKLQGQKLNGNIFLMKNEDDYYLADNFGTELSTAFTEKFLSAYKFTF